VAGFGEAAEAETASVIAPGALAGDGAAAPAPADAVPADRPPAEADEAEAPAAAAPRARPSPNWMLAFVCAWAGGTAFNEAWVKLWDLAGGKGLRLDLAKEITVLGYVLLGAGLLAFAVDALRWGRRRGAGAAALLFLAGLLTLGGVAALILSADPGRRI